VVKNGKIFLPFIVTFTPPKLSDNTKKIKTL